MRQLAINVALFLVAFMLTGVAQQSQKSDSKDDVKRCALKVISRYHPPKPKAVHLRRGEKPSRYPPVIAFEILESGEVVNLRVKRSSGVVDLDSYALSSIQGTKYNSRPAGCGTAETEAVVLIHFNH